MRKVLNVLKALADENRLRALYAIRNRELCVCQIVALLGLAPSTVSRHLAVLRAAGLVESRKHGRWMFYRISDEFHDPSVGRILKPLLKDLERTARFADDQRRLKKIAAESLESLCQRVLCRR